MRRFAPLLTLLMTAPLARADCVVLLHGLARSNASLAPMQAALRANGFQVVNQGYPSTRASIADLAARYVAPAVDRCARGATVHFVTHSMGGIVLRQWLADNRPDHLGRVVMLAPPNQGSELVDLLSRSRTMEWVNGPAGMELGTGPGSVPRRLPDVDFDLGVIAGTRTVNPLWSAQIPRPNDGKVSVESTRVAGMAAHLTLPVTHTYMMLNPVVIAQTLIFLSEGRFAPAISLSDAVTLTAGRAARAVAE